MKRENVINRSLDEDGPFFYTEKILVSFPHDGYNELYVV